MEDVTFELPWPGNQLKKLSKAPRDDVAPPAGAPIYDEVMLFYNDVATAVQERISGHDWSPVLGSREPTITSRPKTIDTLMQKLRRGPSTPLTSVKDIAGVRFEAEMSLGEQDAVASEICLLLSQPAECIRDLRAEPHSGYRAVHLWLKLPTVRAEVQIRTHLQGAWANLYETAADLLGREIRYGQMPSSPFARKVVEELQSVSASPIALMEELKGEIAERRGRSDSRRLGREYGELEDELKDMERELQTAMRGLHEELLKLKIAYENSQRKE